MIRPAEVKDIARIAELLYQVHDVHAQLRPDVFKIGQRKLSDQEILEKIGVDNEDVFVYEDENGVVQGHAFCIIQDTVEKVSLIDRRVYFIDDLCVDKDCRGQKIGEQLYYHCLERAKKLKAHSLKLHAFNDNVGAVRFYERLGMQPYYTEMEQRL